MSDAERFKVMLHELKETIKMRFGISGPAKSMPSRIDLKPGTEPVKARVWT